MAQTLTQTDRCTTVNTIKLGWLYWILGALFYCYEYFLQVSPSVMVPDLMRSFHIGGAALGNLTAFYFYAYASMQVPAGILLDRLGPRRLLTIAVLFCAVGAVIFGNAHSFPVGCLGRFLIGLGSAFAAIGTLHIAATWLPLNRFALLTGVLLTMGMMGAIGAQAPLSIMVQHFGWRHAMLFFGVTGIGLSVLIYSVVRDREMPGLKSKSQQLGIAQGLGLVIKNTQTWLTSMYGALMFLPTIAFGSLWGVPFLMQFYGISRTHAASLVSLLFIGWAIGAPLWGWFSDRIGRRKTPLYIGSIGTLISLSAVLYVPFEYDVISLPLLFLFGFFSSAFLPAFSIVREINPIQTNATALGFLNMLNMSGAAIAPPFIGWLLDSNWQGAMHNGARIYDIHNFHLALMALPICVGISLFILPFIKETYCRRVET